MKKLWRKVGKYLAELPHLIQENTKKLKTTIEVKLALKIFPENKSNVPKLSRSQRESGQRGDRYQRFPKVVQVNIYI